MSFVKNQMLFLKNKMVFINFMIALIKNNHTFYKNEMNFIKITIAVKRNINGNGGLICPPFMDKKLPELMIVRNNFFGILTLIKKYVINNVDFICEL